MIGKMIGHYKILERFIGDHRELYLAEDTRFGRKVAVRLFAEILDPSRAREAFKREAIVASLVVHPNIRAVYGVDEFEGSPVLVMEHMEGVTLEMELLKGPLKLEKILEIGIQIADALAALHSQDIIHRDVKPANIFLTAGGQAKLCNFALATTVEAEKAEKQDRHVVGTIGGISPEILRDEPLSTGTDIFSFGMVLYEMVTGVCPFQKETMEATIDAVLRKKPARISKYRRKVPRPIRKTINEMLVKNPAKRLPSASDLQARLTEVQNRLIDN